MKITFAILLCVLSDAAMAQQHAQNFNCEKVAILAQRGDGTTVILNPDEYNKCKSAEWAANVGHAPGLRWRPNQDCPACKTDEEIAEDKKMAAMSPSELEKYKADKEHAQNEKLAADRHKHREEEMIYKINQIRQEYPPSTYKLGFLNTLADKDRLAERNKRILDLAHSYGYEWDMKSGQFYEIDGSK